eukprot:GHVU01205253.1.p1 GENE.GHVU01205253.1~~GHVU01205253.1.p1  ORF type:complete len:158 (-),score=17.59 GHVU01205253.1:227-700(-)
MWVLRFNLCAMLYEQLLMLELYGGCTLNVDEIVVSHDVYRGLEQLVASSAFEQKGGVRDPPSHAPPGGIPMRPEPMPLEDVIVALDTVRWIQLTAAHDAPGRTLARLGEAYAPWGMSSPRQTRYPWMKSRRAPTKTTKMTMGKAGRNQERWSEFPMR